MVKRSPFVKRIWNKCKCGEVADCLVLGLGKQNIKIIGANCKHCGFKMEADEKEVAELFNHPITQQSKLF